MRTRPACSRRWPRWVPRAATASTNQPERALELLDRLAQRYPRPALAAERLTERAATLCVLGRTAEAQPLLRRLASLSPQPRLLARARASCGDGR